MMARLLSGDEIRAIWQPLYTSANIGMGDVTLYIVKAQDASTLKTVAKWLRSRYTPVGNGYNITAADLDRLAEGKAPFGMEE
ncbi:hypothetical protein LCGC14_2145580 [marine sediment metagenome]|uniref:Uncharacterized protein n=1 Tax=marine sediment metagenome TaxID=412755 RepID=A0A0F9DWZ5_9ZZZZ